MTASLSSRVRGLVALAGAGLVAGLGSGHPELAILAVPVLVFVAVGLVLVREPCLAAELRVERDRLLEGGDTRVTVALRNQGLSSVEAEVELVRTGRLKLDPAGRITVRIGPGNSVELAFSVVPVLWGAHTVGPLVVRARDALGITTWSGRLGHSLTLRAFPREERLRALVAPLRTQPVLGSRVGRGRGEGIEFADIRPFTIGDRVRRVNWRATARRDALYVTQRHPEHSSDVVLLLDTFAEARGGTSGTLDAAVRATVSLARAHLQHRDRVALVDFGGMLHWLEPAFGSAQLYRIVDALLASEVAFSYVWRPVETIPRRVLPPGALVLAITPLLDDRSIRLVTDLRTRGADVTVIEVSPVALTPPGTTTPEALAYRLWRLEREALRARLQSLGIAVTVWEQEQTLGPGLEGVNAFRRSARRAVPA